MLTRNEQGGVSFGRGEYLIQGLIVASLIAFAVETLPTLSDTWRGILHTFERITIACFTLEYLTRLLLSRRRLAYATSFFGLIDLAILPTTGAARLSAAVFDT